MSENVDVELEVPADLQLPDPRQVPPPPAPPMPAPPSVDVDVDVSVNAPYFGTEHGLAYHDGHKGVPREVTWPSKEAAEAAGRHRCGVCKP